MCTLSLHVQHPCDGINKQLMLCIPGMRATQTRQEDHIKRAYMFAGRS